MKLYQLTCTVETDCSIYNKHCGVSSDRKYLQEVVDTLNKEHRGTEFFITTINTNKEAFYYVKVVKRDGRLERYDLYHSFYKPMGEDKEEFYSKRTYYIKQLPNETVPELIRRASGE